MQRCALTLEPHVRLPSHALCVHILMAAFVSREQHGPRTLSFFVRPASKSWAVVVVRPDAFLRYAEAFYDVRFAFFSSLRGPGGGVGGLRAHVYRHGVPHCMYVLEFQSSFLMCYT